MKSKWNNVEDKLPKNDRLVVCYIENTKVPMWSGLKLGSYIGSTWYCKEGRESHEIVTKWCKIPR